MLPASYYETADAFINAARTSLEAGASLLPLAFIGNFITFKVIKIFLDMERIADTVELIKGSASLNEASFIFLMEPQETSVTFSIETPYGVWSGTGKYLPHATKS